jgi:hypothetical protein
MPSEATDRKVPWTPFLVVSIYLIIVFLWRCFVPANEYPSRSVQVIEIALDLLATAGLIGFQINISAALPSGDPGRTMAGALFWIALLAGVGLFVIRFSSDAGWWTGHRLYELSPRRSYLPGGRGHLVAHKPPQSVSLSSTPGNAAG